MTVRPGTLDDYMPQLICGEPVTPDGYRTEYISLAVWYLCSLTPGHDGGCSSPESRHRKKRS